MPSIGINNDIQNFFKLLPAILIAWILVELWYQVIYVFAYENIGLDPKQLGHVTIVAVTVTLFLFCFMKLTEKPTEIQNDISYDRPHIPD